MKALVVGARPWSLGSFARDILEGYGFEVDTAGLSGNEKLLLDAVHPQFFREVPWDTYDRVLFTAGVNVPGSVFDWNPADFRRSFYTNCEAAISCVSHWLQQGPREGAHFAAVSSNSARIPRSVSTHYCVSKAALNMAVKCMARDVAKAGKDLSIYAFEPGYLDGTPMSDEVEARLAHDVALHRMPGVPAWGLDGRSVATAICNFLLMEDGRPMNGSIIPLDAGEQ